MITDGNLESICRACLCNLHETVSFGMYSFLIHEMAIADVLSNCTSLSVSKKWYITFF